MPIDQDAICEDGEPHIPDWSTVTVDHDGDDTYIDVSCSKCGRSGCIGKASTLEEDISW